MTEEVPDVEDGHGDREVAVPAVRRTADERDRAGEALLERQEDRVS